jgi:predicted nucleic acid-binding protein
MKIFLDANVFVSVLNKEYPLFTYSSRILSLAENPKFKVYTSPVCLAIAFYFSEKKSGASVAKKKIELLARHIDIAEADKQTVIEAVRNKSILDFEDGLEYYSALKAKCKCIVTENTDDFHFAKIEVLTCRQFLEAYLMK